MKAILPNPYSDPDRCAIWEMLVQRDIESFLAQDWELVAADFLEAGFVGLDGRFNADPDTWELTFPNLAAYRDAWLAQSREFARLEFQEDPRHRLYAAMKLISIKLQDDDALAHKKFDGSILKKDGTHLELRWQSLFFCRKRDQRWNIAGFVGYLPCHFDSQKPPR